MATGQPLAMMLKAQLLKEYSYFIMVRSPRELRCGRKNQTTVNGKLMHSCLMPSLLSQGRLLSSLQHTNCAKTSERTTPKIIKQCRELPVGAKKLRQNASWRRNCL